MTEDQETYIAVLKAAYDYDPQPEAQDEIPVKENQILLLLEKVDDDWWKVKVKQDEEHPAGLVPSAYVEPHEHISVVKAQYDYDAQQPGELTIKEDEVLYVYDKDDAWLLVHSQKSGGRVGFVPENYVEEIVEGEDASVSAPETSSVSHVIVPPSPPRPSAPYVDPEALVAATHHKAKADNIETWAVSEVDKKGKKKKGTLGVGNGAVFFASESDKTPVQKWQTSFLQSAHIDKSKHVMIEVGGSSPTNLHFHTGSKDAAEAIVAKLKASKELSSSPAATTSDVLERPRSAAAKSVHFDAAPAIIPPREPSEDGEDEERPDDSPEEADADAAVVLYDFTADGEDELSVQEGEYLTILERDTDDWWRVRNSQGLEGVVPASYIELLNPSAAPRRDSEVEDARKAAEEEETTAIAAAQRRAEETAEAARMQEKEAAVQRARVAAAAAEVDRKRRDEERIVKEKEREEQREQDRLRQVAAQTASSQERPSSFSGGRAPSNGKQSNGASGSNRNSRGPPPDNTRIWHDRSGQFRVEAKFLGFANGKLRLHKSNGVIIEVPSEKMSPEDMQYVDKLTNKVDSRSSPSARGSTSDDDEPLASRRRSLREESKPPPKKKVPRTDWFEFFLNAGCDVDDCTRYASSFERDKIDESILPDITESTMRSLGLREGDIIRVKKVIDQRKPRDQEKRDEELARQLQNEESAGRTSAGSPALNVLAGPTPPPNLFAGPNGVLKNNTQRRGRPQPSRSLPPSNVDITAISSASEQIQGTGSPLLISPATPVQAPPRSSSASLSVPNGFDDDAWTNRPSSTKPATPTPSALPAPVPPSVSAPLAPTTPTQSTSITPQSQPAGKSLAKTTEDDVFEQLARLSQLRVQSPAVSPPVATPPINSLPSVVSPPPRSFSSGMGMGPSPVPIGHLQTQTSGIPPQQQPQMTVGPRGPFAPVPVNQSLLQPLIPTTTGFNSFIPTRPTSNGSPFHPPQQHNFLSSQPTGFPGPVMSNPTGFQPSGPQPSSFQSSGFQGLQSQPTGFPLSGNNFANLGAPSFPNQNLGQAQSNQTGFNPGFGHSPFGNNMAIPPVPSFPPSNSANNTTPANVFAQMKAGTFAANNDSAPRSADQYDAFRPYPMAAQPTGWNPGPGTYGAF